MIKCEVCDRSQADHRDGQLHHAFSTDGQLVMRAPDDDANLATQGRSEEVIRGDPILRMALIRKGVISTKDLDDVESEVRATGISHT